jgi:hypothetical protein
LSCALGAVAGAVDLDNSKKPLRPSGRRCET